MLKNERENFDRWADVLPSLSLNYFADELPAAYYRDRTGKRPEDFPVLRRCEARARVRRGCWAEAVTEAPVRIASDVCYIDWEGPVRAVGWLVSQLPVAFRGQYGRDFHRHMLALAIRVSDGMKDGTFALPWCTAEEILIGIMLDGYALRLQMADVEPGYLDLADVFLEDMDYLMLYTTEIAQREDILTTLENELLMVNLGFASWFRPFRKSQKIPGPAPERVLKEINGE